MYDSWIFTIILPIVAYSFANDKNLDEEFCNNYELDRSTQLPEFLRLEIITTYIVDTQQFNLARGNSKGLAPPLPSPRYLAQSW